MISVMLPQCQAEPHVYNVTEVDLSHNTTLVNELNALLGRYHYATDFIFPNFKCSDMTVYCFLFLREHKYEVYGMLGYMFKKTDEWGHEWVIVRDSDKWVYIETTANPKTKLGSVPTNISAYIPEGITDDPFWWNKNFELNSQKRKLFPIKSMIIENK